MLTPVTISRSSQLWNPSSDPRGSADTHSLSQVLNDLNRAHAQFSGKKLNLLLRRCCGCTRIVSPQSRRLYTSGHVQPNWSLNTVTFLRHKRCTSQYHIAI